MPFEKSFLENLRPVLKVQLAKSQTFFGPGTVQLLTLIDETGSVRLACQRMQLSYSKGWKLIDLMHDQSQMVLVERRAGGKSGGSAKLTDAGRALLDQFLLFESRCDTAVSQIFSELFKSEEGTHE